jgi:tagatose 1,6-diphosphate aldolase
LHQLLDFLLFVTFLTGCRSFAMNLTLGRRRALQQCAQPDGTFAMLAMDQRGSLIQMMNPARPDSVTYADVTTVKRDVVGALSPFASAVLLDVEYGYSACVAGDRLSGKAGLLLALEKSGYEGDPRARRVQLVDDWSVRQTRLAGANGVKLLVYYHPDAPNAAEKEQLIASVAEEAHQWQLPLFLEPLHYSLEPTADPVPNAQRRKLVIETAKRLVPLGVDILKAEFPVDVRQTEDQSEWAEACAELTEACPVPWVLLSAGIDYETFVEQVRVACANGASGVLCGRAIWKEAVALPEDERLEFLRTTAAQRFRSLCRLVSASARPFTQIYKPERDDNPDWRQQFS